MMIVIFLFLMIMTLITVPTQSNSGWYGMLEAILLGKVVVGPYMCQHHV